MRLAVCAAVVLALLVPGGAQATLRGYLPPLYRAWIADAAARMPMPKGTIWIDRGECGPFALTCYMHADRTIYTAEFPRYWSRTERHAILIHEIGHAVDFTRLTARDRRAFRSILRLPCRWLDESTHGCDPAPSEVFAEQYLACAVGIDRWAMLDTDWWTYDYAPPPWVSEASLCAWMKVAIEH